MAQPMRLVARLLEASSGFRANVYFVPVFDFDARRLDSGAGAVD